MAIDVLQERIRKLKNPTVVDLTLEVCDLPPRFTGASGYGAFCREILTALKGVVPAVRVGFTAFSVLGADGMTALREVLDAAAQMGYYVILDAPELLSAQAAEQAAGVLGAEDCGFAWNGLVLPAYGGSDVIRPFAKLTKNGKALFPVVRTANRSAAELQDLLSGNRLVHVAAADIISRVGEDFPGKFGYNQIGALAAASSADSLRSLRTKYPKLFLLLDGFDYPNANAKNCSFAFDKLGHGAAACGGSCIAAAWQEDAEAGDYLEKARQGAERMKKNLTRYITVL